jgi:hypothetical protein
LKPAITAILAQHRAIEKALEEGIDLSALLAAHYREEDPVLQALCTPATLAKLRAQHAEALEIAAQLEASRAAGHTRDVEQLRHRLAAIVQHNIIEVERDVLTRFM